MTQELCTGLHQTRTKTECMHCWMQWAFPKINITIFFVFWFQCNCDL
jgi:hypothetical protein